VPGPRPPAVSSFRSSPQGERTDRTAEETGTE